LLLSEGCKLPFYCTKAQWDLISRKDQFRDLCQRCGVPSPETYYVGEKIPDDLVPDFPYPVVVKPVDASLSMGVFICHSEEEIRDAEPKALAESSAGKLIVEEYAAGYEFAAHYTICNGEPFLACLDNRYPAVINHESETTIPIARVYPSLFLEEYQSQVNESMLALCREIGMQNGVLFIQGIYKDKHFYIFEGGLRCAGEAPYRFIEPINGVNFAHLLVDQALLGKVEGYDGNLEDPSMKGKCCGIISFATKGGRVSEIVGLEEAIANTPSVIQYECRYPAGADAPSGNTLRQIQLRFVMICESREQMARDIRDINERVSVLNEQGEDMCLRFDPDHLFELL
jgi:biotin carboxylase